MPLQPYACENCGFWQKYFAPPPDCPVCTDTRNDLPADGWNFIPFEEVRHRLSGRWRHVASDLMAFNTEPPLGLDGTGWLILREKGNVAFEAAPVYTNAMLDEIEARGGIAILSASHVHGYGALWQLQEAFDPELVLHKDDLRMTKAMRVTYPYDDALEIADGLTLHHVGGHYEGQACLHDARGKRLFCGDMFKVDQDAAGHSRALSSHKAFHKDIPLTHGEIEHYRDVIAPLAFDTLLTPFEYAPEIGRDIAVAALEEGLARPPGVKRIKL